MLHKKAAIGEIHKVHNFEYNNEAARLAAVLPADDIGKIAWQKDNDSYWFLKTTAPMTWVHFAGFNPEGNITESTLRIAIRSAGVVDLPSITDNNDGSVTIGAGTYSLYDNPDYEGFPNTYPIAGSTFTLTDNSPSYLLASYNSGTPILEVVTSVPPPNTTDSDRIPIYSLYRSGTDIHYFDWDHLSQGLAEKINQRLRRTDRFHVDNGLALSESTGRVINIAEGAVWAGANLISLNTIDSTSPETHFYSHSAGNWVRSNISQYNSTQYDNGTNLVTLSNSRYAVNWVYRSVESSGAIYVLLGNGDYSLLQAQSSVEPTKPTEISTQAILVGRIIVQKNASTATQIDRVVDTTFGVSSIVNHNDLSNIQGGAPSEYYHLSSAEHDKLGQLSVLSSGSILFADSNGIQQDNTNLFWDDTNNRLGIETNTPLVPLDISKDNAWAVVAPVPTAVASDTGGTIPAGIYYFKVTAGFRSGLAVSAETSPVVVNTSTGSVTISWPSIPNASTFQIFRTSTAGAYVSPSLIATVNTNSFTWTEDTPTAGTPSVSNQQNVYSGKFWVNDNFTTTGTNYTSTSINAISATTANTTDLTQALFIKKNVEVSNPYNHGAQRGIFCNLQNSGTGTSGLLQSGVFTSNYTGSGSSVGSIIGTQTQGVLGGPTAATVAQTSGIIGVATVAHAGRVTNAYGGNFTANITASGQNKPTAGTLYGVRADATHSSTGKTVDAMYGSYGHANATASGGTATRIQGSFFQASAGNSAGGGPVSAPTLRATEGWGFQNVTATSSEVSGGLFTGSAYGTVTSECRGASLIGENQSDTATVPLLTGGKMYALNYKTTTQMYGGFAEAQHNANTTVTGATGMTSAVINNNGGTITDARGYNVNVLNNSGAITNAYGVYIGNVQGTTAYGIYQSGSEKNYLGGNLGLGTTAPEEKLHVSGYVRHNAGWRDNIVSFAKASAGASAPNLSTLTNGVRLYQFNTNNSMHVEFHVDHDIVPNSLAYPHVHFISSSAMTAGQTVTWQIIYVTALGHSQGQSLTAARTTLNLTYTADGTEIAGEHIILESTTGITLVEPDQIILAEYKYTGGTHGGNIYGVMGDLHYQSDREVTLNKVPNFYA